MSDLFMPTETQIERMLGRRAQRGEPGTLRSDVLDALAIAPAPAHAVSRWSFRPGIAADRGLRVAIAALVALLLLTVLALLAGSLRSSGDPVGLLAFARGGSIFVVRPDGTGLRQITHGTDDFHVFWSPDGRRIGFENGQGVFVVAPDGSGLTRIAGGRDIVWADATHIAFEVDGIRGGRLGVAGVQDGSYRELAGLDGLAGNGSVSIDSVGWARDGRRAAVGACIGCGQGGAGSSGLFLMTESAADRVFDGLAAGPRWSPDGRRVAFWTQQCTILDDAAQDQRCTGDILVLDVASGAVRNLTDDPEPNSDEAWSPDGRYLVYEHVPDVTGTGRAVWLERMDEDGSNRRQLTSTGGTAVLPVFDAGGSWIAYAGTPDPTQLTDKGDGLGVWIERTDGTGARKLIDGTNDFDWQPQVPTDSRVPEAVRAAQPTPVPPPACTAPERPATASATGCLVLPETSTADLDSGIVSEYGADVRLDALSETDRSLVPQNRTALARADADGVDACRAALLGSPPTGGPSVSKGSPPPDEAIAIRDLEVGSRICARTAAGTIIELVVLNLPGPLEDLELQWIRWNAP